MWNKIKIDKVDKTFALYVKGKAHWKCEYCGKDFSDNHQGLQVSHYFGRASENTRYDPENCNAFCVYHHHWLGHGNGREEYRDFKIKQLGEKGFNLLRWRSNQYRKKDRKLEFLIAKKLLEELKNDIL